MENKSIINIRQNLRSDAGAILAIKYHILVNLQKVISLIHLYKVRLIIHYIGKRAIASQKIVYSLDSTPTLFMHTAYTIPGVATLAHKEFVGMIIRKSDESPNIELWVSLFKNIKNVLFAKCGNMQSYLVECAEIVLAITVSSKASNCNRRLTNRTTASIAMGDLKSIFAIKVKEFRLKQSAKFHCEVIGGKTEEYLRLMLEKHVSPKCIKSADTVYII